MNRLITFITLCFFAGHSFSCVIPISGPEYDKLIEVKGSRELGVFVVSVPKYLDGYKYQAEVVLGYSKDNELGVKFMEHAREIKVKTSGKLLVGSFYIENIPNYKAYVEVMWPPSQGGMCGVYASSNYLP